MSQITKRALEQSLKHMLLQKPLTKITINDIAEDCGISRMTFYYHFKDIYDLVEWACLEDARKALEVLSVCPPERILLETDSPYLSPVPMRGRRNDPGNLSYICARVAEVKGLTPETVAETSLRNGCDLFRIPYCD